MTHSNVSRNDPCPCGSGKKYKHCCLFAPASGVNRPTGIALAIAAAALVVAVILLVTVGKDAAVLVAGLGVIAAGAWWLFSDPPAPRGPGDPGAISFGG